MIDKRVIAVIVIFILGGLFIYSFANPLDDSDGTMTENNGGVVTPPSQNDDDKDKPVEVNKAGLDEIKLQLEGLNKEDYTEESWNLIQNLIQGANESTSQEEFDLIFSQIDLGTLAPKPTDPVVVTNPNHGSSNTVRPGGSGSSTSNNGNSGSTIQIDKTALNNIKAQLAKLNKNDYTESSWNIVQAQVKVAELQTTQAGFNAAVSQINLGLLQKKPIAVNKTELNNLKNQLSKYNKNDYTEASYNKLEAAANMPENTQDEVNAKVEAIKNAINGLQKKPITIDKTTLNNLKNQLSKYNKNDYTEASYNKLEVAANMPENTQNEVNKKVEAIQNAINGLQKKPGKPVEIDKTALNNIKAQLAKLKESNYTVASWQAIQNQIAVAEAQATQEKFDAEVAKINLNTLQLRPTATQIGVSLDKMGDSANIKVVKVNDHYYRYTGTMNTNTLTTEDGTTIRDFIVMRIVSPEALSQTEKENIKMVFEGMTIDASEFKTDVNNRSYVEIYQPFSRANDGSGSTDNLTTVNFTINWGYGETTQYTVTIDVEVN